MSEQFSFIHMAFFLASVFVTSLSYFKNKTVSCVWYMLLWLHARIQKVLSVVSNFDNVFLVDEGRKDPDTTIRGPSSILTYTIV